VDSWIALPEWWRQCAANAEAEGLAPLLVLKQSRREPLALFQIEVWLSVPDGGGTRVDVITRLSLPAAGIPDVAKAAARARSRVLEEVCKE